MNEKDFSDLLKGLDQALEHARCQHDLIYNKEEDMYFCTKCLTTIITRSTIDTGHDTDLQ